MFTDREDAGKKLAGKMLDYKWNNPLILGVPRGGVVIAKYLWERIGGELDLLITRKIGAPMQPELAVGAVSWDGSLILDHGLLSKLNISSDYIKRTAYREQQEIKRRMQVYRGDRPMTVYEGRQVVLADDGVATGSTLTAAIEGLRGNNPAEIVIAVPVGPPSTLHRLGSEADGVFFLESPSDFAAVGQFYLKFDQVNDEEVISILKRVWGE